MSCHVLENTFSFFLWNSILNVRNYLKVIIIIVHVITIIILMFEALFSFISQYQCYRWPVLDGSWLHCWMKVLFLHGMLFKYSPHVSVDFLQLLASRCCAQSKDMKDRDVSCPRLVPWLWSLKNMEACILHCSFMDVMTTVEKI